MIPGEFHRRFLAAGRILIADDEPARRMLFVHWRAIDQFASGGVAQVQGPMREVHKMTAEIGQRAAAKSPPVTPVQWDKLGIVRPLRHRTEPKIVMEVS